MVNMNKLIDSLYLHFPFCTHLCNYCDFYKKVPTNKTLDFNTFHQYLDAAFFEHQQLIKKHGYSFAALKTFYIGGGTPSFWGKEGKIFLENFFNKHQLSFAENCEFTLEVNPGAWTEESLNEWQKFGANRFSLGIQTLNPQVLKFLDRSHPIEEVHRTLKFFSDNKLNFSTDFMLGLPNSDEYQRDVIAELTEALAYHPSHFSVYILTVKDNYKYYKNLPSEEWIEEEFLKVANFLKSKNFSHYEVSNFSLLGKESKHNLNYWKSKTVAALGPSATGLLADSGIRYKWKTNSPSYELEELTNDQIKLEKFYMALRSNIGISFLDVPQDMHDHFKELALNWQRMDLATVDESQVKLTSKGYLLLDSLIGDLFTRKIL